MKRPSLRQTLTANQRALDHLTDSAGKPRLALYAPEPVKPRAARKPRAPNTTPKEHEEQKAVIQWWHVFSKTKGLDWRQLVAVPNSQMLLWKADNPNHLLTYLYSEGMRKGMLDLVLFHAAGGYHGLLIEMKRVNGSVVSPEQLDMANLLRGAGYKAIICYGADDAIRVITEYVSSRV